MLGDLGRFFEIGSQKCCIFEVQETVLAFLDSVFHIEFKKFPSLENVELNLVIKVVNFIVEEKRTVQVQIGSDIFRLSKD